MTNSQMKILIVGNGAAASALARKFTQYDYVEKVYIAGGYFPNAETIDIREDDLTGLLMFVLENQIDLTVPISEKVLGADVVSFFQSNGQNIFGPAKDSCEFILNKILCKKFLYKIHAQIPKFGMYNKISQINDYLKNSAFPVIIRTPKADAPEDEKMVCPTLKSALNFLEKLFLKGETDVLIEEYTYGHNFTVYFVTDGYSAIPLNIAGNYKFLDENGGLYTDGAGCYVPDYKISDSVMSRVSNIAMNILKSLENRGCPYVGILGLECVLRNDEQFVVQDVKSFLQNHDARAVLNLCEDDLIKIFNSCINGFFSDEYESIKTNELSSASAAVYFEKEDVELNFEDTDDIDFINVKQNNNQYFSKIGFNYTITKTASTISRAKKYLNEEIGEMNLKDAKFRKDIIAL